MNHNHHGKLQYLYTLFLEVKEIIHLQGLLERLANGEVIIGDGSYVITLEKRGLVKIGDFTPQASCDYPDSVKELALEFARAGADVTQTFTFYSTDDKLPKDCNHLVQ